MNPVDHQTFVAMGAEMQRTTGYTAQQSSDLYITDGDWNDWMYGELHRYPITIEISGVRLRLLSAGRVHPDRGQARLGGGDLRRQDRGLPDEDRRRELLVAPALTVLRNRLPP